MFASAGHQNVSGQLKHLVVFDNRGTRSMGRPLSGLEHRVAFASCRRETGPRAVLALQQFKARILMTRKATALWSLAGEEGSLLRTLSNCRAPTRSRARASNFLVTQLLELTQNYKEKESWYAVMLKEVNPSSMGTIYIRTGTWMPNSSVFVQHRWAIRS